MKIEIVKSLSLKEKPKNGDILQFGKIFTDHMFIMDYTEGIGWHDARIVPYSPIALEPSAIVFHYGQAVFEGMKCYKADDGKLFLFRPEKNFQRLNVSNERLCIPEIPEEDALEGLKELIKTDREWMPSGAGETLYIRPFIIATEPLLGVRPSGTYKFIIIISPVGPYYPSGLDPVKIFIEDEYVRAVKGGLGFTKAAANYAASLKGQMKAKKHGYAQVLWLDGVHRKYIEEVGAMNVFFKIGGKVITPALGGSILPGITRDSIITLLKSWGIETVEKNISVEELYEAYEDGRLEEAFGTGTAAVVSPIGEFNWAGKKFSVADGKTGNLTKRIYDELTGIQYGKCEDKFNWIKAVE